LQRDQTNQSTLHENLFILTEENINQDKIIDLLNMLHSKHFRGKIYVILDNAPYQRAKRVQAHAKLVGITLKYQPSYSPNLNIIERLWKFTRKIMFKDKYRATFEEFKSSFYMFFNNLEEYKSELTSLMTESFEKLPSNW
jgi:transposase